jgi:hypothetical protein
VGVFVRILSGRCSFDALRERLPVAWLVGSLLLAGCAATGNPNTGVLDGLFAPAASPGPESEKGGCGTTAQCKAELKTMIDSPDRGWVGQQQSPEVYANGTRLFAYRALRKKLTCRELGLAVGEVRAAAKSLSGAVPGMSPDQVSRTRALSTQVEGELAREKAGRCRA